MPDTLTVTVGGLSVTLDPMDAAEKFHSKKAAITEMLTALDIVHSEEKHRKSTSPPHS